MINNFPDARIEVEGSKTVRWTNAVVTYIRGSLSGNHASVVTAAQVARYKQ
jgi:hypothetical protein